MKTNMNAIHPTVRTCCLVGAIVCLQTVWLAGCASPSGEQAATAQPPSKKQRLFFGEDIPASKSEGLESTRRNPTRTEVSPASLVNPDELESFESIGSMAIVREDGGRWKFYSGSVLRFGGSPNGPPESLLAFRGTPYLLSDYPGSIWFIGEGGAIWGKKQLAEGRIYLFDSKKEPQLTGEGEYSVWISLKTEAPIFSEPDGKGHLVTAAKPDEKLQLLFAGKDSASSHQVRKPGNPDAIGWLHGKAWDTSVFMKRKSRAGTDTPTEPRPVESKAANRSTSPLRFEDLEPLPLGASRLIIRYEGPYNVIYPGSLHQYLGAEDLKDCPGSLWFIAEGGAVRGDMKLAEGEIYVFDNNKEPHLTEAEEYSFWISLKEEALIFSERDVKGQQIGMVKRNEKLQLLLAASNVAGSHKVRKSGNPEVQGWLHGKRWEEVFFMKRKGPAVGAARHDAVRHGADQRKATEQRSTAVEPKKSPNWPEMAGELVGRMEVRVKNPNDFSVKVGLRSAGRGRDFSVGANDTTSVRVPNGRYDIYFQYSSDPDGLYQGDSFTLNNNGVEIQIVKVVGGNYGIRKVK